MVKDRSSQLKRWIDLLHEGDSESRDALVEHASSRIRVLARQLLSADRLHRWEDTDDVMQEAVLAIHQSLETARPADVREFFRLAAFHIRRTLIRLSRKHFGPHGDGRHYKPNPVDNQVPPDDSTPSSKASRSELWFLVQEAVQQLEDEEREVTELVWFHGLAHREIAEMLGISTSTVRRRWVRSRLQLSQSLQHLNSGQSNPGQSDGHLPDDPIT